MRLSLRLLLLLISLSLLITGQRAWAQFLTADDFFHSGAQFYISNNIPAAKERVTMGRQLYPEDDKLKKLEQLLNQQQQSQSNQSQQQQQKDQQSQSQKNQSKDQKQQQQQKDQAEKQKEQEAQKQAQQKQDEDKQKQAEEAKAAEKDKDSDTNEVADAKGAHAMTPKEAERLLDAQKDSEQYLTMKPKDKPEEAKRLIKDW